MFAHNWAHGTWLTGLTGRVLIDSPHGSEDSMPPLIGLQRMLKVTHREAVPGAKSDVCDGLAMELENYWQKLFVCDSRTVAAAARNFRSE